MSLLRSRPTSDSEPTRLQSFQTNKTVFIVSIKHLVKRTLAKTTGSLRFAWRGVCEAAPASSLRTAPSQSCSVRCAETKAPVAGLLLS